MSSSKNEVLKCHTNLYIKNLLTFLFVSLYGNSGNLKVVLRQKDKSLKAQRSNTIVGIRIMLGRCWSLISFN
jgi:hypothetical protein